MYLDSNYNEVPSFWQKNAAIAASLMDTEGLFANLDAVQEYSKPKDAPVIKSASSTLKASLREIVSGVVN
jgi:hypothetical protein